MLRSRLRRVALGAGHDRSRGDDRLHQRRRPLPHDDAHDGQPVRGGRRRRRPGRLLRHAHAPFRRPRRSNAPDEHERQPLRRAGRAAGRPVGGHAARRGAALGADRRHCRGHRRSGDAVAPRPRRDPRPDDAVRPRRRPPRLRARSRLLRVAVPRRVRRTRVHRPRHAGRVHLRCGALPLDQPLPRHPARRGRAATTPG